MLKTNVVMFVAKRQNYAQRRAYLQITSKHRVSYMVFTPISTPLIIEPFVVSIVFSGYQILPSFPAYETLPRQTFSTANSHCADIVP